MNIYEALTLLVALIAVWISLVSLVRTRKAEENDAAMQERKEQRDYRDAALRFLLLNTHYKMVLHSFSFRENECRREKNAILQLLAASDRPVERKKKVARELAQLDVVLGSVRKMLELFPPVLQSNEELEGVIQSLMQSGKPIPGQVHETIVNASSSRERQTYELSKMADPALQPMETMLQRYREELSS